MGFYALGLTHLEGADGFTNIDMAIQKGRGGFTGNSEDDYNFETPQRYNLKGFNFLGMVAIFKL
jgi:cytochrome c peroxidase